MPETWQPGPDPRTLDEVLERVLHYVGDSAQHEMLLATDLAWARERFQSAKDWEHWAITQCRIKRRMAYRYLAAGTVLRDPASRQAVMQAKAAKAGTGSVRSNTLALEKLEPLAQLTSGERLGFVAACPDWHELTRTRLRREMLVWWATQPGAPADVRQKAAVAKRRQSMAGGDGTANARAARRLAGLSDAARRRLALELLDKDIAGLIESSVGLLLDRVEAGCADPEVLKTVVETLRQVIFWHTEKTNEQPTPAPANAPATAEPVPAHA
jgi:hypothetical protein